MQQEMSLNFLSQRQPHPSIQMSWQHQQPYRNQQTRRMLTIKDEPQRKLPIPNLTTQVNPDKLLQPISPSKDLIKRPAIKKSNLKSFNQRGNKTQVFVHHHHYYYPCPPYFNQNQFPVLSNLHPSHSFAPTAQAEAAPMFNTKKVPRSEHQKHLQRIGKLTVDERLAKVRRYIEKRNRRKWMKKVSYDCRKHVADNRLRIKGRFVKNCE